MQCEIIKKRITLTYFNQSNEASANQTVTKECKNKTSKVPKRKKIAAKIALGTKNNTDQTSDKPRQKSSTFGWQFKKKKFCLVTKVTGRNCQKSAGYHFNPVKPRFWLKPPKLSCHKVAVFKKEKT